MTPDMRAILAGLALLLPALAAGEPVAALEQRLRTDGVEGLNAYLGRQPSVLSDLAQRTADCDTQAIALSVRLSRGKGSKTTELQREALRIAVGTCTENVLALLLPNEVPRICASASSWTITQTARELRRRIRAIETDPALRSTAHGKACAAAYVFELENTRVGLRVQEPPVKGRRTP